MKTTFKRGISLLLSLALAFSLMTVGASAEEFADMPTGWSRAAMEAAVENDLLQGSNGKLDPEGLLTRAQLATVVTRAFGAAEEADLTAYKDIKSSDWYFSALAKAKAMGVMNGTSGSTMAPAQYVTRQEVFVILARAMQLTDGTAADLAAFADAGSVSDWAVGGTAALVRDGYIQGSNGHLSPRDNITREQFAQILYNIFGAYYREAGTYTGNVEGSLMISTPDVTVKNATVKGDLVIGDGVGEGDVTLNNVTVEGRMVVRGGGVNSIHIISSRVGTIVISKADGNVRVKADSASSVEVVYVNDGKDDVVIEGKVGTVVVEAESTPVVLKDATVKSVQVNADNAAVSLTGKTKVMTVEVAENTEGVKLDTAKGTSVGTLKASSDVTFDNKGSVNKITGDGSTTDEKGDEVKPSKPTSSHSHSYAAEWTFDDTHHWHAATCSHTEQKGSYAEHDYSTVVSDTATCTEAGTQVLKCVCGKTIEQDSPAKGHSYATAWSKDDTDHWHAATCEHSTEIKDKAAHSFGNWTYADATNHKHTCTVCGQEVTEAHHAVTDAAVPPTCTDTGLTAGSHCDVCNTVLTAQTTVSALGHDFENGATRYDADGHWSICARTDCTATDTKTPHSYNTTDCTQAATCDCGYEKPAGTHTWGA